MVIKPKFYLFSPFVINFQLTFHLKMKNLKIDDKWKKGKKGVNHCLGVDQQQGIAKSILFFFCEKDVKYWKKIQVWKREKSILTSFQVRAAPKSWWKYTTIVFTKNVPKFWTCFDVIMRKKEKINEFALF